MNTQVNNITSNTAIESVLIANGYIDTKTASEMLGLVGGSNVNKELEENGCACVQIPLGNRGLRRFYLRSQVSDYADKRKRKNNNHKSLNSREYESLISEVTAIRRCVVYICEQLGIEPKFDA